MVTNIPSRCIPYWNKFEEATTTREKIVALEELIACIPKHKGTEKLLKDLKIKLAKLRAELDREILSRPKPRYVFSVSKKGDAQAVLIGTPYTGKTSLINRLCNSAYPVDKPTTRPQEGIFKWSGCEFQIVDLPPITGPDPDNIPNGRAIMGIAYNADLICMTIDATQDFSWQLETLLKALEHSNIILKPPPPVTIKRTSRGGVNVIGIDYSPFDIMELKEILKAFKISNCVIEFHAETTERELYLALNPRAVFKKAIVVLTKMDRIDNKLEIVKSVRKLLDAQDYKLSVIPFSIECDKCAYAVGNAIFRTLNLLRVWTKKDGVVNRDRAIVLRKPATIRDVCEKIHSSFVKRFRYAILERPHDKIKRRNVGLDYEVLDGDIVSICIS